MANTLRDLRELFPFVGDGASDDLLATLSCILDVRLTIMLRAVDLAAGNIMFNVRLSRIFQSALTFEVDGLPQAEQSTITVPVYIGRDNDAPAVYSSGRTGWAVADSAPNVPPSGIACTGILLHPDCVLLMQRQPSVSVLCREIGSYKDDGDQGPFGAARLDIPMENGVGLPLPDNAPMPEAEYVAGLSDGYNVTASVTAGDYDNKLIRVTGGAGLGLGLLPVSAYTDGGDLEKTDITGLRSINGIYDACSLRGAGTVSVLSDLVDGAARLTIKANYTDDEADSKG